MAAALAAHPRVELSHGPTPLERLENLGRNLKISLWAKRDDCNGLAMGGNKVRQLEYYFGRGAARGADTVLITGAVQSNFVRLTAANGLGNIGGQDARKFLQQAEEEENNFLAALEANRKTADFYKRAPVINGLIRRHEDVLFYIRLARQGLGAQ